MSIDLVLVNSPIQEYEDGYRPDYRTTAPLGLGYLGTIAQNAGIRTLIVDAEAEKLSIPEIRKRVNDLSPKSVGINMTSTNHQISLGILEGIDAPHKMVGGAHATLKGQEISAENPNLLVVAGEAEDVIVDAVRNQRRGFVNAGRVQDLDRLPFIDRSLFFNDPYAVDGRLETAMTTQRGCPFSCNFCSVPNINGRRVRGRSLENVMAEIRQLKETRSIDSIHFMDDIFNYNRKRLEEFCDASQREGLGIDWRALTRVELLDEDLLEKMKKAGCYKIALGIESGVPRILRYIGKCDDLEHIRRVFRKAREVGIETKVFFTMGSPIETEDEIKTTIDFAQEIAPNEAYFMVVRAYPGTRLYEDMLSFGRTTEDLDSYRQFRDKKGYVKYHVMNARSLNGMSEEKLDALVKEAYSRFYKGKEVVLTE